MTKNVIGIDFGTSTSVIRVKEYNGTSDDLTMNCKPVTMSQDGQVTAPTLIRVNGEKHTYGHDASQAGKGELYSNFKLLLRSNDLEERKLGETLLKDFYSYMFSQYKAEKPYLFSDGNADEETVVSYPPQWNDEQESLVIQAARSAGFKNVRGMDEATASVNCVLNAKHDELEKSGLLKYGEPLHILVIDMGAGTTDLAFVKLTITEETKTEIVETWPPMNSPYIYGGSMMDSRFSTFLKLWLRDNGFDEEIVSKIVNMQSYQIKQWKEQTVSGLINADGHIEECATIENTLSLMGANLTPMPVLSRATFEEIFSKELKAFTNVISSAPKDLLAQTDLVFLTGGNSVWYWIKNILCDRDIGLTKIAADPWRIMIMDLPNETVARGLIYAPAKFVIRGQFAMDDNRNTGNNKAPGENIIKNNNIFSMKIADKLISGRGPIVTGKIQSGLIHLGDTVTVEGSNYKTTAEVNGITMNGRMLESAQKGDEVGILLSNIEKGNVAVGDLLSNSRHGREQTRSYILTLKQDEQWFLTDSTICVDIDNLEPIEVGSGKSVNISLAAGRHSLHCHFLFRKCDLNVELSKNTTIVLRWNRITGKIEARKE